MRRKLAMLLAMLAAVSSLTVPALAAEPEDEAVQGTAQAETAPQENGAQENGAEQEEPAPEPDPEGTVSWANLDERIRSGSLSARILIENITGVEDLDYDQMYEDLRRQLNSIAQAQWMMILMGWARPPTLWIRPTTPSGRPLTPSRTASSRRKTPTWSGSWRTR